ncbi:response regulator [bacterium]|nr:response regulator [bacterium]NIN91650.1 response regulator [bacterium]NIO17998.1 response regulator [bacterium]NIO72963.1 response regulator [bacterium]
MSKEKILVIEDEEDIANLVKTTLEGEGFEVTVGNSGEEGLEEIHRTPPDLLVLDLGLPGMSGYQVCQKIREDVSLAHIPIIMLTAKGSTSDKVVGLSYAPDDYITKPFQNEELVARVKTHLTRTASDLSANPLTKLPGNIPLTEALEKCLSQERLFAVLYLDLSNFKAFNDKYSYLRGDKVLRTTAQIILKVVKEKGNPDDFIGHIGGDDFIVITSPDKVDAICKGIIKHFDQELPSLYDEEDRKRKYIITKDRQNKTTKFPLMTISIGVVTNRARKFTNPAEISDVGAELKKYAKSKKGSSYVVDKRED